MALKSLMLRNSLLALLNQKQMVIRRIPQFPFRPIHTNLLHVPIVDRHHVWTTPHLLHMMSSQAATPNPPQDSTPTTKTVKLVVSGRISGTYFEEFAVETANELGIKGYYRYIGGAAEVLCSGDADKVDEMVARCQIGPDCAIVSKFQVKPSEEDPGTGFNIRPFSK